MKTVTQQELRRKLSAIMDQVRVAGESFRITYRGKLVAVLSPFDVGPAEYLDSLRDRDEP